MKNKIMQDKIDSLMIKEDGTRKTRGEVTLGRNQKRKLLKTHGINPNRMNEVFKKSMKVVLDLLPDDTVVKLNYDRIMENKENKSKGYLDFVEKFKDKDVTVFQDEKHKGTSVYLLREDDAEDDVKWIFDISDLIYDEDQILNELMEKDGIIIGDSKTEE